jgi:hypothetical protein
MPNSKRTDYIDPDGRLNAKKYKQFLKECWGDDAPNPDESGPPFDQELVQRLFILSLDAPPQGEVAADIESRYLDPPANGNGCTGTL